MMGTFPGGAFPPIDFFFCDVRDVAKAHLEACVRPEANNQRFIVAEPRPFNSMGTALVTKYGESYPVITKTLGTGMVSFLALFIKDAADMKQKIGLKWTFDTSNTNKVLGIKFIDFNKTMDDMAVSMIELGHVPDNRGKVL